MTARVLAVVLVAFSVGLAVAQVPLRDEIKLRLKRAINTEEKLRSYLAGIKGDSFAQVKWVEPPEMYGVWPEYLWFSVRYPQYPIAVPPPDGLKPSNLFAFAKDGKRTLIQTAGELRAFFKKRYRAGSGKVTREEAIDLMRVWLRLSEELMQDGYYRFETKLDLVNERGTGVVPQVFSVTGMSIVSSGGKGEMRVLIDFNEKARIEEILEKNRIERGPRPSRTSR